MSSDRIEPPQIESETSSQPDNEEHPPIQKARARGLKISKTYDHILNDPVLNEASAQYEAMSVDEQRIYDLVLDKKIRSSYRKKKLKTQNINLEFAIKSNDLKSFEFQSYLEQVTKQLELEGLWREELQESTESDMFFIDDVKGDDLDENFNPKELHVIYNPKNMSMTADSITELKEQGLEWQSEISFGINDFPELSHPTLNNLIRRAPWSIYESMARKLVEGSFFLKHSEIDQLYPCAYFVSKSIFSKKLFIQVKYEAFARTPLQKKFRTYPYIQYLKDQKALKKLTNELLKKYFYFNQKIIENIKALESDPKETSRRLDSIWKRFFVCYQSLTKKQKEALELVYMNSPQLTYENAAKNIGISKDSFQDRVKGAIKKLKKALPELNNLAAIKTYYKNKGKNLLYYGLFNKASSMKIHPLFRVSLDTGEKIKSPIKNKKPTLINNSPKQTAVRAWSIVSTPVPDIMYTDFYLGLIPEGHIRRITGMSKFRG